MEQTTAQTWNLTSLYDGTNQSAELKIFMDELRHTLEQAAGQLQSYRNLEVRDTDALLEVIGQFQFALLGWEQLDDFAICTYAEDVKDQNAIALMDESMVLKAKLSSLQIELDQAFAEFPDAEWQAFIANGRIQAMSFYLNERRQMVKDRLPVELERMISALSVNGIAGWEQQHELTLTKLRIPITVEGELQEVSIGQALNEAVNGKDRDSRLQAVRAIDEVCDVHADTVAAILNRVAGSRLAIYQQRGWDNKLKEMLEHNRIQEASIDAMLTAIDGNKNLYRAYIERKLKLAGVAHANWSDLETPVFSLSEKVDFAAAKTIISEQFHQFSDKLGHFADRAFAQDWIEAENRPGKAEGGFCASMPLAKESRIFLTYRDTYQDLITLAHELGHAYHNYILHDEPALAQQKGVSVAETASTFMENLVLDAVIDQTQEESERLAMLETKIRDGLKYVVSVPNMFRFEQQFYGQRASGMISAEQIKTLIAEVENDIYGGLVEELALHKWMFIGHFYDAEKAFYNIPYTIGYLFSNGVYEQARKQPDGFPERYDALLRDSGKMTVEQLGEHYLGADITQIAFWRDAQKSLTSAIEEYLELTEKHLAAAAKKQS
ncbi:oligoendopeptidase F [Planococcus maritimus]|uniref:M3 family oligoendopeptidase n=1 Tax=Planococcus maritimus TaxID=192421 RepID=UPI00080F0389|nr:M3 family oligoendopeptidase [Planococcus maritimus]ANU18411.1 oligoendopeptidase F [Planococcus maritimus]